MGISVGKNKPLVVGLEDGRVESCDAAGTDELEYSAAWKRDAVLVLSIEVGDSVGKNIPFCVGRYVGLLRPGVADLGDKSEI